jgi:hypothetical protein
MRKTLSPLVWSARINEALERPSFKYYKAGIIANLQITGNQPDNCFNQLQDQFHRG